MIQDNCYCTCLEIQTRKKKKEGVTLLTDLQICPIDHDMTCQPGGAAATVQVFLKSCWKKNKQPINGRKHVKDYNWGTTQGKRRMASCDRRLGSILQFKSVWDGAKPTT